MRILLRLIRVLSLVILSVIGTSLLMYMAPGYFTDAREMDAAHAVSERRDLQALEQQQHSSTALLRSELMQWAHGDLGTSRQYGSSVTSLVRERVAQSTHLLVLGSLLGWSLALFFAVLFSLRSSPFADATVAITTALLLALPIGVLATVCLLTNTAGPVSVLACFIAARDLKLLHRLLSTAWLAPYVLHARAQGSPVFTILRVHLWTAHKREFLSVAVMSFTLALSALVPVEVIFDVPGLGHLAWSAAMNRDLPVLVAVTGLLSVCIGVASSFLPLQRSIEVG